MYEALGKRLGVITHACKIAEISRETHYRWLREDENYKQWIEEIPELTLDFAENALYKLINSGNVAATIFYLKTKGKHRGYIEKQEVEYSGNPFEISVNIPKEVKDLIEKEKCKN